MSSIYYRPKTSFESEFYSYYRNHGRGHCLLPFPSLSHYQRYYDSLSSLFCQLHPYNLLNLDPSSSTVFVGVHSGFVDIGCSMFPIATSVLSRSTNSPSIHICEADRDSCQSLHSYTSDNNLPFVSVHNNLIWTKNEPVNFEQFDDWGSSNIIKSVLDRRPLAQKNLGTRSTSELIIDGLTLASFLSLNAISSLSNLFLTVNGAEQNIIQGASDFLSGPVRPRIIFPLRQEDSTFQILSRLDYTCFVCDSHTKFWSNSKFFVAVAVPNEDLELSFTEPYFDLFSELSDVNSLFLA